MISKKSLIFIFFYMFTGSLSGYFVAMHIYNKIGDPRIFVFMMFAYISCNFMVSASHSKINKKLKNTYNTYITYLLFGLAISATWIFIYNLSPIKISIAAIITAVFSGLLNGGISISIFQLIDESIPHSGKEKSNSLVQLAIYLPMASGPIIGLFYLDELSMANIFTLDIIVKLTCILGIINTNFKSNVNVSGEKISITNQPICPLPLTVVKKQLFTSSILIYLHAFSTCNVVAHLMILSSNPDVHYGLFQSSSAIALVAFFVFTHLKFNLSSINFTLLTLILAFIGILLNAALNPIAMIIAMLFGTLTSQLLHIKDRDAISKLRNQEERSRLISEKYHLNNWLMPAVIGLGISLPIMIEFILGTNQDRIYTYQYAISFFLCITTILWRKSERKKTWKNYEV